MNITTKTTHPSLKSRKAGRFVACILTGIAAISLAGCASRSDDFLSSYHPDSAGHSIESAD